MFAAAMAASPSDLGASLDILRSKRSNEYFRLQTITIKMVKISNKKAAMNAALLIAIIAGLIILYIIFLPDSEREQILDNGENLDGGTGTGAGSLLKVAPGALSTSSDLESEKSLPDIFLQESVNAKEIASTNPFIVQNGWFNKKDFKWDFDLENTDVDNAVLSFTTKKRSGELAIKLNNDLIFESEITKDIINPIKLDRKKLMDSNTLEFSVSSVGAKFWSTNEYSLDNIKIIGDITDKSRQESENIFVITENELQAADLANLKFIPYCSSVRDISNLEIYVNNKKVFSNNPVCDKPYNQAIPKNVLNAGENNIVFKTKKGTYSIEQIRISLDYKEPKTKTYYFQVSDEAFTRIRNGDANVVVTIKLIDDGKQKRVKMDINGKAETVDTSKSVFTEKINTKISKGNNYIRLEPFEDVEIVELLVDLV